MGKTKKQEKPTRKRNETESQKKFRLVDSNKLDREEMEESFLLRMSAYYNRGIMRWPQTGNYQKIVQEIIRDNEHIGSEADFWYEMSGGKPEKIRKERVVQTLGDILRQAIRLKYRTINEYLKNTDAVRRDFLFRILRRQSLPTALKLHDIATDLGYKSFYSLVRKTYRLEYIREEFY